jgi:hypothetical protein
LGSPIEGAASPALRQALFDASHASNFRRSAMENLFLGLGYFKNSSETRQLQDL